VQIKPDHTYSIVKGLSVDAFAREKMNVSQAELVEERGEAEAACNE